MGEPAITVDRVSKRYALGRAGGRLGSAIAALWRGQYQTSEHWALRDVSFTVSPGDALGIIGPNGSGKTTMLKVLSRVTYPSSGRLRVRGRLSALVELGAGFHPDLTGRENVFLNAAILGLSRAETRARFDRIVEFSGVGNFLDTPVKRYSSGMYARLGFAVAAHVDPDVLLVDEVLAVGDYAFQQRCHALMRELRERGTALVFVSHDFDAVRRVCNRAVVLYRGELVHAGTQHEAIAAYSDRIRNAARTRVGAVPAEGGLAARFMTFDAEVASVGLYGADDRLTQAIHSGDRVRLVMEVAFHKAVDHPGFGFFVSAEDGRAVYVTNTQWMGIPSRRFEAGERLRVEFSWVAPLLAGSYELGVDVPAGSLTHFHDRVERALSFSVVGSAAAEGLVDLAATVTFAEAHARI